MKQQLDELTAKKERLEAELSRKSGVFRTATEKVTRETLVAAIPAEAVVVDYLEFGYSEPSTEKLAQVDLELTLLAFVMRAGTASMRISRSRRTL